jgi:hypothetical protein
VIKIGTGRIVSRADNRKIIELTEDETGRDTAADKSKILESGRKSIKLGHSCSRTEYRRDVDEVAVEPKESLCWPDGGVLGNVFVGGGHVGFGEKGMRACVPESVAKSARRRHAGARERELV